MSWEKFNKMPDDVKENLLNDPDAHRRQSAAGGRAAAQSNEIFLIKKKEEEELIQKGAEDNAEANRIGWDDDYKP